MKWKNELQTLRSDIATQRRAAKLLNRLVPHITFYTCAQSAVTVASAYFSLWFSAELINELVGTRDLKTMIVYAALAAGGEAGFLMLNKLFFSKLRVGYLLCDQWEEHLLNEKSFSMDYKNMEDPEVRAQRQALTDNAAIGGLKQTAVTPAFLLENTLYLVVGVAMLFTILFRRSPRPLTGLLAAADSPWAALGLTALALGGAAVAAVYGKKFGAVNFSYREQLPRIARRMDFYTKDYLDDSKALMDLHIFRQKALIVDSYRDTMRQWKELFHRAVDVSQNQLILMDLIKTPLKGIIYGFVALKVIVDTFGLGDFLKYASIFERICNILFDSGYLYASLHNNALYLEKLFAYLDRESDMHYGVIPTEKRDDNQYDVEFRDVSFKYPGSDEYALRHFSFKMRVGERVAVVGKNGSGKTTMIKLLCRLYDPTEGVITLNGIDIKKYNYEEYQQLFSVVFQDFRLFALPLGQNVAAAEEYDEEKATECLRTAGLGERLAALPQGLHTAVEKEFDENGVMFSGGEKQKIALARALYKDAPFVVLDEPTAALDPVSEAEIFTRFNEIAGVKTAVYISHRLASCRFCDKIAVFDAGQLVQFGSHDDLLAQENGLYRALWNAQAQYYAEEEQPEAC